VSGPDTLQVHALRFGFYSLLQVLASAAMFGVVTHMVRHQLAPDLPQGLAIDLARQSFNLILGFGLSIPVFFVYRNAWIIWIVVPLVVSRWRHRVRRRRSPRDGPGQPPS
jgi:TMEM175 potassium channel family protein